MMEQLKTVLPEMSEASDVETASASSVQSMDQERELRKKQKMTKMSDKDDIGELKDLDDLTDMPISSNAKTIRRYVWLTAFLLVVLQIVFLKWWAILTAPLTLVLAFFMAEFLIHFKTILRRYKMYMVVWTVAIVAIILEAFLWQWWACLSGIATLVVAYLISCAISRVRRYFNGKMDE